MFWLAFGTAAAVIGLALMTIGVTRLAPGDNLFASWWFDGGIALLAAGVLLLLWALWLFLNRRSQATTSEAGSPPGQEASPSKDVEAVRGYFAERERLYEIWEKQEQEKRRKG